MIYQGNNRYFQGTFKPTNPNKYVGDVNNIIYRSQWEFKFMMYLDHDPSIVGWSSEELKIPYVSPVDQKIHRYFPDFFVKKRHPSGLQELFVVEIKPRYQVDKPVFKKQVSRKRLLRETKTYAVNQAKWAAARAFCQKNKMKFLILTEKELRIK